MCVHRADLEPSTPTSLVLSMAFKMATFSFSRAARTFTYSPRYGPKYSGGKGEFDTNLFHGDIADGSAIHRYRRSYTPESLSMSRLLKDKKHPINHLSIKVKMKVNPSCSGNIVPGKLPDLTICCGVHQRAPQETFFSNDGQCQAAGGATDGRRGALTWCAACRWSNTAPASAPLSGCHQ